MALIVSVISNAFLDTVSFDIGGSYMGSNASKLFYELVLGRFPCFEGEKYVKSYLNLFNDNEPLKEFYDKFKELKQRRDDFFLYIEPWFDYEDIFAWAEVNRPELIKRLSDLAAAQESEYDEDD